MSTRKNVKLNEEDLVGAAEETVAAEAIPKKDQIVSGRPLPEGFENPEIGKLGHYCIDPKGRYQKNWYQLKIAKTDESMPSRQYFCNGASEWWVKIGVWVDVPPELMSVLENAEVEVIEMDVRNANLLTDEGVRKVVNKVPRFSYQVLPSA